MLKFYVEEIGSELMREHRATAAAPATSLVTIIEARAALARRRRISAISPSAYRHAVAELTEDWERYLKIGITEALVKEAAQLAETHRLRGYDALHLGSALWLAAELDSDVVFASWDDELDAAAAREGLSVLRARRPSPH